MYSTPSFNALALFISCVVILQLNYIHFLHQILHRALLLMHRTHVLETYRLMTYFAVLPISDLINIIDLKCISCWLNDFVHATSLNTEDHCINQFRVLFHSSFHFLRQNVIFVYKCVTKKSILCLLLCVSIVTKKWFYIIVHPPHVVGISILVNISTLALLMLQPKIKDYLKARASLKDDLEAFSKPWRNLPTKEKENRY